jgi:hypothetical protein
MDFVPVLSSLLGVIIGSLLTFLVQWQQRKWSLQDLRRQWRKERLETRINSVQNILGQSLTHLGLMAEEMRQGRTNLAQRATISFDTLTAANVASITIGDTELAKLFFEYALIVKQIRELYERGELTDRTMQEYFEKAHLAVCRRGLAPTSAIQ